MGPDAAIAHDHGNEFFTKNKFLGREGDYVDSFSESEWSAHTWNNDKEYASNKQIWMICN